MTMPKLERSRFAAELIALRAQLGLSPRDLAVRLGIRTNALALIEQGTDAPSRPVRILLTAMKIDPELIALAASTIVAEDLGMAPKAGSNDGNGDLGYTGKARRAR